jgi:hypothetical protein
VGNGRHDLAAKAGGQIGEDDVNDRSANVGEGVAVKEEERGATMSRRKL